MWRPPAQLVYIVLIFLLLVQTAIKDLDLDLKLVDLDLTRTWLLVDFLQVCLTNSNLYMYIRAVYVSLSLSHAQTKLQRFQTHSKDGNRHINNFKNP